MAEKIVDKIEDTMSDEKVLAILAKESKEFNKVSSSSSALTFLAKHYTGR